MTFLLGLGLGKDLEGTWKGLGIWLFGALI
jgi:hypothetical protein